MEGVSRIWLFIGSCVELDGAFIDFITDDDREVELSADEFWSILGDEALSKIDAIFGYDAAEWSIKDDSHIEYRQSRTPPEHVEFPNRQVIFFDHSRIEYVWILS